MPKLPVNNNLDYNPNSIINASKKITAIALENLKNPVLDPDAKTLSTLEASKKLDESIASLQDLAGLFHSGILRIQNLFGTAITKGDKGEGSVSTLSGEGRRPRGRPRKVGGSNGDWRSVASADDSGSWETASSSASSSLTDLTSPSVQEYRRRLQSDRQRFRDFYPDDDRNSTARPSVRGFDFDASARNPTARTFGRDGLIVPEGYEFPGYKESKKKLGEPRSFTSLMFALIQTTRRMDILVSSRIRPAIRDLSGKQIELLNSIYQMVSRSYRDIIFPLTRRSDRYYLDKRTDFPVGIDPYTKVRRNINPNINDEMGIEAETRDWIVQSTEYGDEILNTFDVERRKLMLNLSVVINSWKQNTPTGQQTEFTRELEREFKNNFNENKFYAELAMGVEPETLQTLLREEVNEVGGIPIESVEKPADWSGNVAEGSGRRRRGRPRKEMTLVGSGRNFYGEKVDDSRDIPTIYSQLGVKNCPTKYLL